MTKFEMTTEKKIENKETGKIYPDNYLEKKMISVDDIIIDTTQARHGEWEDDDRDRQLIGSVEEIGLIYDIIVRPTDSIKYGGETDMPYACVAGSRRFNAMIAVGHTRVPCIIRDLDDIEAVETSLSENIGRKDLTDYQEQRGVNLWFDMLWEKRTREFMENNEINEISNTKKKTISAIIAKEIAKKLYGENQERVYEALRMGDLPSKVQILLKKYHERTPEEIKYLKSQGISEKFIMGKKGFLVLKEIEKKYLGDSKIKSKTQKIFEMIKKSGLDKEDSIYEQAYILKDIRDKLAEGIKKGKSFEIIMEKIQAKKKEFEFEEGAQRYIIRMPPEYIAWHNKACAEFKKSSSEVISYIYLSWLKKKAKKNDW